MNNNIYITGYTTGSLDGNTHIGGSDIFIMKIDSSGNKIWTKQWGSDFNERGLDITTDSNNIYVTGYTNSSLDGNTNAGDFDIFLTKYDSSGNKIWTKQWGTSSDDRGKGVTVDSSGNIYVTGNTVGLIDPDLYTATDIFLIKYDGNGNQIWTRAWGTSYPDFGSAVVTDNRQNIYITGNTHGLSDVNTSLSYLGLFLLRTSPNP